jgi:hypothetical protein
MNPNEGAYQEPEHRHGQADQTPTLPLTPLVDERCGVDAHERDKGPEIERLGADFIGASTEFSGKEFENAGSG